MANADFDLTKLVSCVVCSIQLPNQELLKKHLHEKHNMSPERDLVQKDAVKMKLKSPPSAVERPPDLQQPPMKKLKVVQ